jgi:hypothetical protein
MDDLFLLSEPLMRRIKPYFPLSHGIARVSAGFSQAIDGVCIHAPQTGPGRRSGAARKVMTATSRRATSLGSSARIAVTP